VGDTTPSRVDLSVKDLPGPLLLQVTDIDVYDHNPRLFANEKIEDIEASLKANGFHDALVVTRRREGDRYMLAAGSNTTLRVLQELWRATQDERYLWVNCVYQPYEKETKLLAQHLGENLNRGDMRFWEIAKGMVGLLDQLDADAVREGKATKPMGLREQAEALTAMGLRASKSQVALWRFTTQYLAPLGDSLQYLTFRAVQDQLQPRTSALRALAARFGQHGLDEASYWREIVAPVLARHGSGAGDGDSADALDAAKLCDSIEAALAERVGESVASIRQMLSLLKLSPELTLADLRRPSPNLVVGRELPAEAQQQNADSLARMFHQPRTG
jgi:ParB family protein of integrating conjugative element (PFGI_1 class)